MTHRMKIKSNAQRVALEKYIHGKTHFQDFSAAQGYAACYTERVEPLAKLLAKLLEQNSLTAEEASEISALLKKNPVD